MAVDAKLHLKVDGDQAVLPFHLSMARGAIDPVSDVRLVIEFYMIGDIKYSNPRDWGLRIEVPPLLHNLRVLGNNVLVTKETEAHRRNPGISRSVCIGMAKAATDLLVSGVDPMAEVDRLLGSERY